MKPIRIAQIWQNLKCLLGIHKWKYGPGKLRSHNLVGEYPPGQTPTRQCSNPDCRINQKATCQCLGLNPAEYTYHWNVDYFQNGFDWAMDEVRHYRATHDNDDELGILFERLINQVDMGMMFDRDEHDFDKGASKAIEHLKRKTGKGIRRCN